MLINHTCVSFKSYVLEKHLKKYETIHPLTIETRLGKTSLDIDIYPRCLVQDIHTRDRWFKLGQIVRAGEKHVKKVKASCMSNSDNEFTLLYGKWQCVSYVPPIVSDTQKIPTNIRGNIELWTDLHLPKGCVHISKERWRYGNENKKYMRTVVYAAKRLNMDYAKAMVGFDQRKGRCIPVFNGIVILEKNEKKLKEMCIQMEQKRMEREAEKKEKEMFGIWKVLIQGTIVNQQLEYAKKMRLQKKNKPQLNSEQVEFEVL